MAINLQVIYNKQFLFHRYSDLKIYFTKLLYGYCITPQGGIEIEKTFVYITNITFSFRVYFLNGACRSRRKHYKK